MSRINLTFVLLVINYRCESWCASNEIPFFRLNPELNEGMSLNEIEDAEIINSLWLTKAYMHSKTEAIDELALFLENIYFNKKKTSVSSLQNSRSKNNKNIIKK